MSEWFQLFLSDLSYIVMLIKRMENLDGNSTRMIRAILNKSWKQRPAKKQLYDHLPPISKTNEQDMRDTAEEVRTNL